MQNEKTKIYFIAIILFVLISRMITFLDSDVFLSDDDAGFALAAYDYNIEESRPHLPGYYLLIKAIATVNIITDSSFLSMKIMVILFSVLSAIIIFKLFEFHFNGKNSFLYTLIIFTNPLVWFYQSTPESYVYDLFFASLIALVFYKRYTYFLYLPIISIMGGIRMSSAFFLIPLYLFITYIYWRERRVDSTNVLLANLIGLLVTAIWVITLLNSVGGLSQYLKLYSTHNPMPAIGMVKNIVGFLSYSVSFGIPFLIIGLYQLFKRKKLVLSSRNNIYFLMIWIIPGIFFFIFGHYSKGYILLIYPALIILIGLWLDSKSEKILITVIAIQSLFFLFYPYTEVELDSLFRREVRQVPLQKVAWNRLNNGYLHAYSRISNRNELFESFDSCVSYLKNNDSNFTIFDGKTSLLSINSEVYRYPEIEFVTQKNFFREDEYIYQNGTSLEYRYGLEELYSKVYILSDVRMIEKYSDLIDVEYETNIHALIKVKTGKEKEFKEFYENLYSK